MVVRVDLRSSFFFPLYFSFFFFFSQFSLAPTKVISEKDRREERREEEKRGWRGSKESASIYKDLAAARWRQTVPDPGARLQLERERDRL